MSIYDDPYDEPPSQLDELITKAIDASLNSRKARRERMLCAIVQGYIACPDQGAWPDEEMVAYAETLLDASDAIDAKEQESTLLINGKPADRWADAEQGDPE